ncbi:MAG: hypothetical protein JNK82_27075 [Myxococcaceae bacterium]|nr:hypothetical protein [Myxococcaceae bacterium]
MLHRMAWVLVALAVLAAPGAKKKTPSSSAATDAAIKAALDAEQQKVADCVVSNAPPGAWSKTVTATVKINASGQVLSAEVKVEPDAPPATRECIEKVLRAIAYPKSPGPLTRISREWSFAMK